MAHLYLYTLWIGRVNAKRRPQKVRLTTAACTLFVALILVPDLALSQQDQFAITGEIRPRAEFRNGYKRLHQPDEDAAFFVEQRSRLYFDYKSQSLRFMLSLQDVRVWGNTDQIYKSDPALHNIREAWGEYLLSGKVSLKVGRQSLSYDNERFLGALEWSQQGRAHDAMIIKYVNDSARIQLHGGAAFNQNVPNEPSKLSHTVYSGINNYKTMQYVWFNKSFGQGTISLLVVNDGRQNPTDSTVAFLQTFGTYGRRYLSEGMTITGEAYYQTGERVPGQQINGYLAAINLAFLSNTRTPLTVGLEHLSGTDAYDTKNKSFDPTFGTNHAFYGSMDYFYSGHPHGQNGRASGLTDGFVKIQYNISKNTVIKTDLHYFSSAVDIYTPTDPAVLLSRYLGTELDLAINIAFSPVVSLNAGYSHMFSSESLKVIKGNTGSKDVANNWAWAMMTIKPVLLKTSASTAAK